MFLLRRGILRLIFGKPAAAEGAAPFSPMPVPRRQDGIIDLALEEAQAHGGGLFRPRDAFQWLAARPDFWVLAGAKDRAHADLDIVLRRESLRPDGRIKRVDRGLYSLSAHSPVFETKRLRSPSASASADGSILSRSISPARNASSSRKRDRPPTTD